MTIWCNVLVIAIIYPPGTQQDWKYKTIFSSRSEQTTIPFKKKASSSYQYLVVIMTGFVFVWKILLYHGELHWTDFSPRNHTSTRPGTTHAHSTMIFCLFYIFFILITFSTRPGTVHAHFMMMIFLKLRRSTSLFTCSCQKGFVATGQLLLPNNLDGFFVRLDDMSKRICWNRNRAFQKKTPFRIEIAPQF